MTSTNAMPGLVDTAGDGRVDLHCPVSMPQACGFLWNPGMLLQVNCRGFVTAQHMQPEAAKYSHAPVLEQTTFMQPEQPLYAHHPGRFVYVRDDDTGELFSLPYEPVRRNPDAFAFSVGPGDIEWRLRQSGLDCRFGVQLPVQDVLELWSLHLHNTGPGPRRLTVCTSFTIGYMSWMNQSAGYSDELGGIVARSVTPYQALDDWQRIKTLKDLTFLVADSRADAWEASRDAFEGEGGLASPAGLQNPLHENGDAIYETPIGVLQYRIELSGGESRRWRFLFGPAANSDTIAVLSRKYLADGSLQRCRKAYGRFLDSGRGCLRIATPEPRLDHFVNHWLGRQVYYHGNANRLTTDPQTRNFLQDTMGMSYVDPRAARKSILHALGRQQADGSMPEGIVLSCDAELKYINRIPHTDHCVWLPVCVGAYLDETADFELLDTVVEAADASLPAFDRVTTALRWLIGNRDDRGLSLIAQGDWCDPMNMVGPRGKGVSGWLSIATVYALRLWARTCSQYERETVAEEMFAAAEDIAAAVQKWLWDGDWFARGVSDDGTVFGTQADAEGKIYLNPQSWAMLAAVSTPDQNRRMIAALREHLETPYGMMVLAPAYTSMREHIGRLTQKHPGVAENGSIYNHAATFYLFALLQLGEADLAFEQILRMIPGTDDDDFRRRGQLPVFVPNYYRGAVRQFPRTAGRSSQLVNTGAASWLYRSIVERLFGLRGTPDGLVIEPNLPSHWAEATATRHFRGATLTVQFHRGNDVDTPEIRVDGRIRQGNVVRGITPGESMSIDVALPAVSRALECSA